MARFFNGYKDESVIVVKSVFPDSDLIFSTPIEFSKQRSGVYIEGNFFHQMAIFEHLKKLLDVNPEEIYFGKWIWVSPPDDFEEIPHIVMHYEATEEIDKLQLLNLVLPRQLAIVCNLKLSWVWEIIVRIKGEIAQKDFVVLPQDVPNGEIALCAQQKIEIP
ncbi:MAG: hypothetical protein A2Y98_01640 [Candidatus Portnoybacteria bacterium RBG_19FT_COMBO_36_7]|uniref:Uncharacterized protein n=1 Tax=Candidatus Portnoybacteria bacterium RBG_19FT_COMBO_36_7 TaxID=1801992 RepID=A0A1G2F6B4_9BACT|nr:MAG: hypothetical protein A2Y98_01640 [Candidatus Portnoybacteria bacterium RBG_19FT_COMBO_36_7]